MNFFLGRIPLRYILLLLLLLLCLFAIKADLFARGVELTGYLNFVANQSSNHNRTYRGAMTDEVNFLRDSSLGLNFSTILSNDWSAEIQLSNRWEKGSSRLNLDMAQLTWAPVSWYRQQFGLLRPKVWMLSDHLDIGVLYPWTIPPEQVYFIARVYSYVGTTSQFNFQILKNTFLNVRFLAGNAFGKTEEADDVEVNNTSIDEFSYELKVKDVFGGVISIIHPNINLSYSHYAGRSSIDTVSKVTTATALGDVQSTVILSDNLGRIKFESLSAKINYNSLHLWSEYVVLKSQNSFLEKLSGFYTTVFYNFKKYPLTPHLTYANDLPKSTRLSSGRNRAYTIGLNYAPSLNIVLKSQFKKIKTRYGSSLFFDGPITSDNKTDIYSLALSSTF